MLLDLYFSSCFGPVVPDSLFEAIPDSVITI